MARSIDWIALYLFDPISGVIAIPSSINMSTFPESSGSNSISRGKAWVKGTELSSMEGSDNFAAWGEQIFDGSQSSQCKRSFARSAHNSENAQNSVGHGEPPKVSLKQVNSAICPFEI